MTKCRLSEPERTIVRTEQRKGKEEERKRGIGEEIGEK
jgi:hypothetical protein